jgi:hypothetical protein
MENKSTAYWDGWISQQYGYDQNPYSSLTQSFSSARWNEGYWDRYNALNEDLDLDMEAYDNFALWGERY